MPGYGNKCNREIELMALGVVPIVTPGVDVTNYFEPLIENVHYIFAKTGEELLHKVNILTEEEWTYLSESCLEWYEQNCSPKGSFETTIKAVNKLLKSPDSFSTLATDTSKKDLELFYSTLRNVYPKHDIYLVCDEKIENWAKSKNDSHLHCNSSLEKYAGQDRKEMEAKRTWTNFMLEKCTAIDDALRKHNNTLFLDSDQCILNKIEVDVEKEVGLSPHMVYERNEKQFGKYNGGFIFVNSNKFSTWWRENTPRSKYMEQGILEEVSKEFSTFEFDSQYNYGWWRLLECDNPQERASKFSYDSCLKYENKPVTTLHTHFFDESFPLTKQFNNFILTLLPKENEVRQQIMKLKENKGMILIQSYYNPKDKKRQEELELCLKQNCFNTSVEKVLLFLDHEDVKYPKHEKIEVYSSVDQLTYQDAFFYAEKFYKDRICCLVNNDIFLDHGTFSDLSEIDNLTSNNIVLSLTRHEFNVHTKIGKMDDAFRQALFAHTQDAWIWKANFQPKDTNFRLGTLGCDNAINDRLKQAGKIPMNLGSKYKVYHVDAVRGKTSTNKFSKEKHAEFHDFNRESYPEERGQFLTPDYGMVYNLGLDEFAKQLNFSDIDKYTIICEMLSRKMKIKNR